MLGLLKLSLSAITLLWTAADKAQEVLKVDTIEEAKRAMSLERVEEAANQPPNRTLSNPPESPVEEGLMEHDGSVFTGSLVSDQGSSATGYYDYLRRHASREQDMIGEVEKCLIASSNPSLFRRIKVPS